MECNQVLVSCTQVQCGHACTLPENFHCITLHLILRYAIGAVACGVEPASYYRKVLGSIPRVCMLKCPWARH